MLPHVERAPLKVSNQCSKTTEIGARAERLEQQTLVDQRPVVRLVRLPINQYQRPFEASGPHCYCGTYARRPGTRNADSLLTHTSLLLHKPA